MRRRVLRVQDAKRLQEDAIKIYRKMHGLLTADHRARGARESLETRREHGLALGSRTERANCRDGCPAAIDSQTGTWEHRLSLENRRVTSSVS